MRIGGVPVDGPKKTVLVIPRDDGDIVFKFVAVGDDAGFDKLIQPPVAPVSFNVKLQQKVTKTDDPGYQAALSQYYKLHSAWVFLQSIAPSEIEWDTVDLAKPETWTNWQADLKAAGFSLNEVNVIYAEFNRTNVLSEAMIQEARTRFLLSGEPANPYRKPSLPPTEPSSTATTEPASDGESAPPG